MTSGSDVPATSASTPRLEREPLMWPRGILSIVALTPPLLLAVSVWYSQAYEAYFLILTAEGGWVESGQAILFAVGALLSARIAWRLHQSGQSAWAIVYSAIALGLGWVTGEELSWGQHLLAFPTPEWFQAHNRQGEFNIHNIPGVAPTIRWGLDYVLIVVSILSGLAWRRGRSRWRRWQLHLWVPHHAFIPAWLCVMSYRMLRTLYLWRYSEATTISRVVQRMSEPIELIFALAVVVFLTMVLGQVKRLQCDLASEKRT